MLSPLQPSVFLQVFATTVLSQDYIKEAENVGSCCNGGFATRVCCRKIENMKFCVKYIVAENWRSEDFATRSVAEK